MLKLIAQTAIAAAIVAGSTTLVAAQGFDPNGANRFQRLAQAGTAGFYLGELQGPMAATILQNMATSQVSLTTDGQIDALVNQPPPPQVHARSSAYAPRSGMVTRQVSAPIPGYVTPQY